MLTLNFPPKETISQREMKKRKRLCSCQLYNYYWKESTAQKIEVYH